MILVDAFIHICYESVIVAHAPEEKIDALSAGGN